MSIDIIVVLIAFVGTALGTFGGILISTEIINFRIEQLESNLDKHNNFTSRVPILEEQMNVTNHRIEDLERHGGNDI